MLLRNTTASHAGENSERRQSEEAVGVVLMAIKSSVDLYERETCT